MIISFDFWGTLATLNPHFIEGQIKLTKGDESWIVERNKLETFWETNYLNYKNISKELKFPKKEDFYLGLKKLGLTDLEVSIFIKNSDELFKLHHPIVIKPNLKILKELISIRDKQPERNLKIGIVSNTSYISGKEITNFLFNILGLRLDFFNYSDSLKIAKPNPNMFETRQLGKVDIHIGDSPKFDDVDTIEFINSNTLSNITLSNPLYAILESTKKLKTPN